MQSFLLLETFEPISDLAPKAWCISLADLESQLHQEECNWYERKDSVLPYINSLDLFSEVQSVECNGQCIHRSAV